ncbi:hypothetical protein BX600DRAFT_447545 [Xylariales sp. PMI_506]|nr:hypothetical protein BX600DRAFT_447545 [Xylariales sp. PMI_506]
MVKVFFWLLDTGRAVALPVEGAETAEPAAEMWIIGPRPCPSLLAPEFYTPQQAVETEDLYLQVQRRQVDVAAWFHLISMRYDTDGRASH